MSSSLPSSSPLPPHVGRLLHFPHNFRFSPPYNFSSLGIQPFDDQFYQLFLDHKDWTKYETLELLELVRTNGLDHFDRDVAANQLLAARQSLQTCEARLCQIFSLVGINQLTIPIMEITQNPYKQNAGEPNNDSVFPRIGDKNSTDFQRPAAARRSLKKENSSAAPPHKKSKDLEDHEPSDEDDEPRGPRSRLSARLANQRKKNYAFADDSDSDDFPVDLILSDPENEVFQVESEFIWKIEKILAERQRRVKVGEESKEESDEIIEQQVVDSTIKTVEEHRKLRFKADEKSAASEAAAAADSESASPSKQQQSSYKKLELDPTAQYRVISEYLIKIEGQSYLHIEWHTTESLKQKFGEKSKDKVNRWNSAKHRVMETNLDRYGGEPFDSRFTLVDRVIDSKLVEVEQEPNAPPLNDEEKTVEMFLVKWQGMSYSEATWEVREDVDNESEIARFRRFNRPISDDRNVIYSPQEFLERRSKWYSESMNFKNKMKLRDYQVQGVNWLIAAWYDDRNCILADEMGLGKTVQVVSLFEHLRKVEFIFGPFLVVVPLGTVSHWKKEIETWTDMNVVVYHDPIKGIQTREIIRQHEFFYPGTLKVKFNILVTTYEVLVADMEILANIEWRHCVCDEGHRLKNKSSKLLEALKTLNCNRRLLLTGTPIQNNTAELYTLLNFLEPEVFGSSAKFQSQFGNLEESAQVQALQQRIRPFMLRRMKEAVEKSIPPKEETIIDIELTMVQKKYYKAIFEKNFAFLRKGSQSAGNMPRLVNIEMELRKVCNHPWLCSGAEDSEIPHNASDIEYISKTVAASGKMLLLDKLLPKLKADGHRVLIFSQMIPILDLIQDWCYFKGWGVERLDGSIRGNEREMALDRYNAPDSDRFIFLLTTRAGGVGLNLATADTVIIFDSDWNPQMDTQAMARAHRIGQKNKVSVYRLVTRNTYESLMFLRASKKLGLDHAVLTNLQLGSAEIDENDKSSIDKILRLGAYGILDEEESNQKSKEFEESNIDDILRTRAHVIQISKTDGRGGELLPEDGAAAVPAEGDVVKKSFGLNYTKMKFSMGAGKEVDINDPAFWDKVLGGKMADYEIPADELLGQLTDGQAHADAKSKANFWSNMTKTVESTLRKRAAGDDVPELDSVVSLLIQFSEVSAFSRAQRDQARIWLDESDKRVERKARNKNREAEMEELMRIKNQTRDRAGSRGKRHDSDSENFESSAAESESDYEFGHEPSSAMEVGGRRKGRLGVAMNNELCDICHQSGSLVGCDAGCYRWYHLACINKTEADIPPETTNWICPDCDTGRCKCLACGEIGEFASETPEKVIHRCIQAQCGRYFHLSCIKNQPLASILKEESGYFRCPAHLCARCDAVDSTMWLVYCENCPVGLHVKCMNKDDIRLGRKQIYCENCAKAAKKTDVGKAAIRGAMEHTQKEPVRKRQRLTLALAERFGIRQLRGHKLEASRKRRPVARGSFKSGIYTVRVMLDGEKVHELVKTQMFEQNQRQRRRRRTAAEMAEAKKLRGQPWPRRKRKPQEIDFSDYLTSDSSIDSQTDESEYANIATSTAAAVSAPQVSVTERENSPQLTPTKAAAIALKRPRTQTIDISAVINGVAANQTENESNQPQAQEQMDTTSTTNQS